MYFYSPFKEVRQRKEAETVSVSLTGITDYILLRGTVVEQNRKELYPKYMSKILNIHVSQGDWVSKGDILMTLEVSDDDAAVAAFYSELKSRADIEIIEKGNIDSIEAGMPQSSGEMVGEQYCIISPISGMVMDVYCAEGESVSGVFPCIAVSDMKDLAISAEIGESNVSKVKEGMSCSITVPSLSDWSYLGRIDNIAPYASASSLLSQSSEIKTELIIGINNPDSSLRPGYTAELKIILGYDQDRLLVPYKCVSQDETGEYVMQLLSDYTLKRISVVTGRELENGIEIVSGLEDGCTIVLNPDKYSSGERIKLK
ncbi:MAG: efflux RND transporter periplasmic adaptor subunit [Clostridiaceae bacterium]|nr:efflux RND transporter periplasmic adaptor subunit [Clostridiaceae bacterium]